MPCLIFCPLTQEMYQYFSEVLRQPYAKGFLCEQEYSFRICYNCSYILQDMAQSPAVLIIHNQLLEREG